MPYMLDTNICVYVMKRAPRIVWERLRSKDPSEVWLSTITLSELEFGVECSTRPAENRERLMEFISPLQVISYDARAARAFGEIRAFLEARGQPIGPLDTQIAAHARSLGCTLVTNNEREFERVPGLQIENWAR